MCSGSQGKAGNIPAGYGCCSAHGAGLEAGSEEQVNCAGLMSSWLMRNGNLHEHGQAHGQWLGKSSWCVASGLPCPGLSVSQEWAPGGEGAWLPAPPGLLEVPFGTLFIN